MNPFTWMYKYLGTRLKKRYGKLRTSFMRRTLRLVKGRQFTHLHSYWPYLKISAPDGEGRRVIYHRKKVLLTAEPIAKFHNTKPENVFIWGAGPSVNMMDFDKIPKDGHIFLNTSIMLAKKHDLKPLAYMILDQFHIIYNFNTLHMIPDGTDLILTPPVIKEIADRDKSILLKNRVFLLQNILEPYDGPSRNFSDLDPAKAITAPAGNTAFSLDPDYGFTDGGTVLTTCVQLAFYMRAANTYIMGLDISEGALHFFEKTKKTYYPTSKNSGLDTDYLRKILPFMTLSADTFKQNGLNIYNCSPVSKLPFDIIPLNTNYLKN